MTLSKVIRHDVLGFLVMSITWYPQSFQNNKALWCRSNLSSRFLSIKRETNIYIFKQKQAHCCSNMKLRIKGLRFIHSQGRPGPSQLFVSNSTIRFISIKERFEDNCEVQSPRSDWGLLRFCSRELARIKFGYENKQNSHKQWFVLWEKEKRKIQNTDTITIKAFWKKA